jgi:hypothetical protein
MRRLRLAFPSPLAGNMLALSKFIVKSSLLPRYKKKPPVKTPAQVDR